MTKETKVKLLQVILNAGIKGTDRGMLDNLKAVIKAIENEDVVEVHPGVKDLQDRADKGELSMSVAAPKRKPGRPFKKR